MRIENMGRMEKETLKPPLTDTVAYQGVTRVDRLACFRFLLVSRVAACRILTWG